jgi:hypothetical protein
VAIYAVQQDRHAGRDRTVVISKPDDIKRYADAFATAGINPWIWGYPWAGREQEFVDLMGKSMNGNILGWILDPELGYKWKGGGTKAGQKEATANAEAPTGSQAAMRAAAAALVKGSLDALTEKHGLGVTSYGMAGYHKNLPWTEFGAGWGSPQLYEVSPQEIDAGIASWRELGWDHIAPSVPAFGSKSGAKLHDFLSSLVDGNEAISGFVVWSWRSISPDEWRVFARWSDWFVRYPKIVR